MDTNRRNRRHRTSSPESATETYAPPWAAVPQRHRSALVSLLMVTHWCVTLFRHASLESGHETA
ncbi:MAG TPA: hypothetical protein VNB54_07380, partial [Alphaproteobacteria bacterium]|nr:hypothetical protein [Alphaproteobacteria bacterium]